MKHNIQKLPLCQLCEKSQAGLLILLTPLPAHSARFPHIWQMPQRVLLPFQKPHRKWGGGGRAETKASSTRMRSLNRWKFKTDEPRKSSLSILFTNVEVHSSRKWLPLGRGTHTRELYFVTRFLILFDFVRYGRVFLSLQYISTMKRTHGGAWVAQ